MQKSADSDMQGSVIFFTLKEAKQHLSLLFQSYPKSVEIALLWSWSVELDAKKSGNNLPLIGLQLRFYNTKAFDFYDAPRNGNQAKCQ